MRFIVLIGLLAIALAGCGGGSSSPTAQAAGLLSQAGATSSGPAYTVTSDNASSSACDQGNTEADGTFNDTVDKISLDVNVCVFPSNAQLENDAATAEESTGPGGGVIQVGQTVLIYVGDNDEFSFDKNIMNTIAGKTGGQVLVYAPTS